MTPPPIFALPLVLAGPVLRRVEPGLVSVWVATSEPCTVKLIVYANLTEALSPSSVAVASGAPLPCKKVGDKLYVGVAWARPSVPLTPGQLYSYDVFFQLSSDGTIEELKSLHFLEPKETKFQLSVTAADGRSVIVSHERLPLGYDTNMLPSFAVPPGLDHLVLMHGSCREGHADGEDSMAYADDVIGKDRLSAANRPHLFVLTGDQIYADEIAPFLMERINPLALQVVSASEQLPLDGLPFDPSKPPAWKTADLAGFPAAQRRYDCVMTAGLSTGDGTSHLLSFGEFCAAYLLHLSNRLWWKVPDPANVEDRLAQQVVDARLVYDETKPAKDAVLRGVVGDLERLKGFYDTLPRVQRALANVSTLMMFDDHEVSDDWNITFAWKQKVLLRALGRALMRNALASYAVFQDWGNDPLAYETAAPPGETPEDDQRRQKKCELLATVTGTTVGVKGWGDTATPALDRLFGLTGDVPTVSWQYGYGGDDWDFMVLDTRTRRSYLSAHTPPRLISEAALLEQIPSGQLPARVRALFVLSPVPVVGPSLIDEVIQPLMLNIKTDVGVASNNPNTYLDKDPESWALDPVGMEAMLARLYDRTGGRPVIFLSGDVHYSTSDVLDYWRGTAPMRFIQLTSSAFKNVNSLAPLGGMPLGQLALTTARHPTRLGWKDAHPQPFSLPAGGKLPSVHLRRVNRSPLLLPADGWPAGTQVTRPAEWSWRYEPVVDTRPDPGETTAVAARPGLGQNPPTRTEVPAKEARTYADYLKIASWHGQLTRLAPPRRVVFPSVLGLVRVRAGAVNHEMRYVPLDAPLGQTSKDFTLHVIALEVPAGTTPPTLGAP